MCDAMAGYSVSRGRHPAAEADRMSGRRVPRDAGLLAARPAGTVRVRPRSPAPS